MFRRPGASAILATALVAVAAALVPTASTAAPAATAPGFVTGADLPQQSGNPWSTGKVVKGLPETVPFCLTGALPAAGSWHRDFVTELDTRAGQISVRTASDAAAARLVTALERKAAACAADWLRTNPGGTASWQDYGPLPVEEGAHVYGTHVSVPDSEPSVHLYGIGRDGSTVTVVDWSRMGHLTDAPVAGFKKTTTKAVNRLVP
ncbi:hypothetical protein [Streptomyces subrutilus]|uniref:PknH-like extracellular domain-containing protein n=1 Tax=Streptomyces subrutilus TaxID=36818 RepID=A0A5P2UPM4_9ACTN|nr:hypothetical protein [Streptomyces subrutilus]QEU81098.1 hypothetical protein CP968_24890 [Streptomyces subrutilus]WSJ29588.1 hypothetical protein OG479_09860 [Streptomyces subrutilus]GGZ65760.1 hypothetical protein GCM10010371_26730 [Streptomyces subrutilus]